MEDILKMSKVLQEPYKMFKADSGAITFHTIVRNTEYWCGEISLISKECPHKILYEIELNYESLYIIFKKDGKEITSFELPDSHATRPQNFWLSWYNDTLLLGVVESSKHLNPFFVYADTFSEQNPKQLIGFIRVTADQYRDFIVESSPVLRPISHKHIQGGQLRWVSVLDDRPLPKDALIGGFENEPIYIARSFHGRSLCPGKYVPSKKKAFVPWGHAEHAKKNFEILCGYNALWVKCKENFIPENAFIAGSSEVHGEDVYIGRAMIGDDLVVGKIHMLYKTCYLPYKGKEVERHTYEILVRGDITTYGQTINKNCLLNPMKALQPCI
ncbi:uncharacterized protein LOC123878160 [Maniola jurtina]|uniref:uncharacterized protein LOC123878160 n=1 Tax=Maniola jurtina TaxID=191418 RepID=UPI001E68689B|nr:uncharacterized protein LOC123878160 [Maniola jurtina]